MMSLFRFSRVSNAYCAATIAAVLLFTTVVQAQTPLHGHYPPGQTGLRGAAFPQIGWSFTDFNRFFSNLEIKGQDGNTTDHVGELRYANIAMIGWNTPYKILGMSLGAIVGVPFASGNLNPDEGDLKNTGFDLGDIIVTPISLSGTNSSFDYQFQFSVWTPSGRFHPGAPDNRGSGFWSLIYSAGGVWYPQGDRTGWSVSAIARIEQNFDQRSTGITPGDNFDVDWGIGRIVQIGTHPFDVGVSGFGTWQITDQSGGPSVDNYRYLGAGPEISTAIAPQWNVRLRAQWEFAARNAVQGNNIWLIVNHQF